MKRTDEENLVGLSQRCNSMCERASVRMQRAIGSAVYEKEAIRSTCGTSSPYKQEDTGEDEYC